MDELDRLYRRLVQNIRSGNPDYLTRPFEVSELYQTLVPYRHNRRELEIETNQDYEMALMRLLAGERGYLTGDERMMKALRDELASSNPDLTAFRAYATTPVQLAGDGARAIEPPVIRRPTSGESAASAPAEVAAAAARPTLGVNEPASPAPVRAAPPRAAPPPPPPPPSPVAPARAPATPSTSFAARESAEGTCRYCAGELPEGRKITFCPHCGQNLTVQHCPACGTELEIDWKFCTTCGRGVA